MGPDGHFCETSRIGRATRIASSTSDTEQEHLAGPSAVLSCAHQMQSDAVCASKASAKSTLQCHDISSSKFLPAQAPIKTSPPLIGLNVVLTTLAPWLGLVW